MLRVSAGQTNAIKYFVDAEHLLEGDDVTGCPDCRADGSADEILEVTV